MTSENIVKLLNEEVNEKSLEETLGFVASKYAGKIVFTSSFGYEDQVITDMIFRNNLDIEVITLDTGRMFEETYKVYNKTLDKYGKSIKVYFPEADDVEKLLNEKGPISFYNSIENRKECCHIRKVKPLQIALDKKECWITGLRADQSSGRGTLEHFVYDPGFKLVKYNPLLNWSLVDVKAYIKEHNVPYNSLHDRGFVSIGCEPCTRAIQPGDDFRAGRWWWENNTGKECGLHTHTKE